MNSQIFYFSLGVFTTIMTMEIYNSVMDNLFPDKKCKVIFVKLI